MEFLTTKDITVSPYVARQSLISAFWPVLRKTQAQKEQTAAGGDAENPEESKEERNGKGVAGQASSLKSGFQRRQLVGDSKHNLTKSLIKKHFDVLLWDLVDERSGYYVLPDGDVVTDSVELHRSGWVEQHCDTMRHVEFGSVEYMRNFRSALTLFKEYLDAHGLLEKSLFVMAPLASVPNDPAALSSASNFMVKRKAEYLEETFTKMRALVKMVGFPTMDVPARMIRFDAYHRWGPAPYHYSSEYYRYVCQAVEMRAGLGARLGTGADGKRVNLQRWYQVGADRQLRVRLDSMCTGMHITGKFADDGTLPVRRMKLEVQFTKPISHAPQGLILDREHPGRCYLYVPIDGVIDVELRWEPKHHVVAVRLISEPDEELHLLKKFTITMIGATSANGVTMMMAEANQTLGKWAYELKRHPRIRRTIRRVRGQVLRRVGAGQAGGLLGDGAGESGGELAGESGGESAQNGQRRVELNKKKDKNVSK